MIISELNSSGVSTLSCSLNEVLIFLLLSLFLITLDVPSLEPDHSGAMNYLHV